MVQKRAKLPVFLFLLLFLAIIVIVFEGAYFWLRVKKNQEASPNASSAQQGGEYLVKKQISVWEQPDKEQPDGYIIPGKRFMVLEKKDDWLKIRMVMEGGLPGATGWIKADEAAYQPAGEK